VKTFSVFVEYNGKTQEKCRGVCVQQTLDLKGILLASETKKGQGQANTDGWGAKQHFLFQKVITLDAL
jgi:hypothetical protein